MCKFANLFRINMGKSANLQNHLELNNDLLCERGGPVTRTIPSDLSSALTGVELSGKFPFPRSKSSLRCNAVIGPIQKWPPSARAPTQQVLLGNHSAPPLDQKSEIPDDPKPTLWTPNLGMKNACPGQRFGYLPTPPHPPSVFVSV